MDSQNKTKRQSCPCLNIFLMKISGMFLSFSSEWLTKELEWEVHLGVPCLSDIVIERERERDWHTWLESRRCGAFWRLQIEPISLLIWYHFLWFHPRFKKIPAIPCSHVSTYQKCGLVDSVDHVERMIMKIFLQKYYFCPYILDPQLIWFL